MVKRERLNWKCKFATSSSKRKVLLQEANRKKLANRAEVRDAINNARDSVLINALIADFAKKNPVKDADVKKFYEEQKKAYGDKEYKVSVNYG